MADKNFTGDELKQVAQQLAAIWAEATAEEKEKLTALFGKIGKSIPAILASYSPGPGNPSEQGTITIPIEKLAASASLAVGIGLGLQAQTRLIGQLIQALFRLGAEHIPGEITIDQKLLIALLADWGSLLSKISAIARRVAAAKS